jgi:hypothetical protein
MARLPWPVWASLAANVVLFAAKLACYLTTRSLAIAASLVDSTVVREGLGRGGGGFLVLLAFFLLLSGEKESKKRSARHLARWTLRC